jgi:hypothetical protein
MKLYFRLFISLITISVLSNSASSLPRFALRGGEASCRGCHLDPTGGRIRTEGGDNFAMNRLAMWPRESKFSGNISDGIRMGVDLRSQFLYFSDYMTAPGRDTTRRLSGGLEMALPIYFSAKLSDAVQAFVKADPVTSDWEGYAIVHYVHSSGEFLESGSVLGDAYIKVGAFIPAYGIRFDDHTVYTRGGNAELSGFGPAGSMWQHNYKDEGAELGFELFDHAFITADILNGNEQYTGMPFKLDPYAPYAIALRGVINSGPLMDKQLSAEIGGSLYVHTIQHYSPIPGPPGDSTARTWLTAIHGGLHYGPLSFLAEFDMGNFVFQPLRGGFVDTMHAMAIEASAEFTKGLTGILRFDNFYSGNVNGSVTNIKTRIMVGFQWFPVRFLEFRPEFRIARGTGPQSINPGNPSSPKFIADQTETTALLQTHVFF